MASLYCRLARAPIGTKYVLEACGPFVRRYVEFPDGRKARLPKRRAASCECSNYFEVSIVPAEGLGIEANPEYLKPAMT